MPTQPKPHSAEYFGPQRDFWWNRDFLDLRAKRWRLAEAATELAASRLLVAQAAARIEAGADAQLVAAQAKLFATRTAERQLPVLAQAMGDLGSDYQL